MTVPLVVVPDEAPDDGALPIADWNRAVDHIKACFPYSRPWTVETQQAFYDALCHFSYPELIGAASALARTVRRDRERPSLAEMVLAANGERAALRRRQDEARLRVVDRPFNGWRGVPMEPPGEDSGPYYRLAYAMATGEVDEHDAVAKEAYLSSAGLPDMTESRWRMGFRFR